MKTDISFLPISKQEELQRIVDRIVEELNPLVVVLFGSYARNEWVEDYQGSTEYVSDYDLLIITRLKTDPKEERKEERVLNKFKSDQLTKRASVIAHSLHYLNKRIEEKEYFFFDIYQDGIVLFNRDNLEISSPKELSLEKRKEKAERQFDRYFKKGEEMQFVSKVSFERENYETSVFLLHQAVENFFAAILLTFTDYKPKLHDLVELEKKVLGIDPAFLTVFPKTTDQEKLRFKKLKDAYVDARYNVHYKIEKEDLEYLAERIEYLQQLTEEKCKLKIEEFAKLIQK